MTTKEMETEQKRLLVELNKMDEDCNPKVYRDMMEKRASLQSDIWGRIPREDRMKAYAQVAAVRKSLGMK